MITYFNINALSSFGCKQLLIVILAVFTLSNVIAAPQQRGIKQQSKIKAKFVEGEILIRFKSTMTMQAQQSTVENNGGRSVKSVSKRMNLSKVKLQSGDDLSTVIEAYKSNPNVEYAQPNYIYYADALPNDTNFNQLWGLKNTGQTISNSSYTTNNPGVSANDIDAELAWNEITDCRSAVVAVLDTGINYTHQDLTANMWDGSGSGFPNHGYDYVDSDNDPMPTGGGEDHGTHVAGTIGAIGNNGSGVAGVCWQASIMSVRVLGASGSGSVADIIQGIEFATDNGAKVINMSLGSENNLDTLFSEAITYARSSDVVVVVAAGNGGNDSTSDDNDGLGGDGNASTIVQPCNFTQDNLLCVAALDQSYSLASFSNYGETSVDIGAPGTNILNSYAGQKITDDFTGGWTINNGWVSSICNSKDILSNPSTWCSDGYYANTIDDRAYKSFDLSGVSAAELSYYAQAYTQLDTDYFYAAMKSSSGDPFAGGGTNLLTFSGVKTGATMTHDISSCNSSTCTLGFRLTSDDATVNFGVAIKVFKVNTLQSNSASYYSINGTSMASPHVAGIATMIRAFNPNYTYAQTVEAIKNGGEAVAALSGKSATGKAVNAMGSLAYITQPTGVTAVVQ